MSAKIPLSELDLICKQAQEAKIELRRSSKAKKNDALKYAAEFLLKNKADVPKNSTIVCVLTGNGLKDPDCAIENNDSIFHTGVEAEINSISKRMGL